MFGVRKAWEAGMMPIWAHGMILPNKQIPPGTVLLGGIEKKEIVLRYNIAHRSTSIARARAKEMSFLDSQYKTGLMNESSD
jgi:hypothetical protein